ncbi:hypothetical protein GCM10020254_64750 [Streptomyces goshikiensis]
MTEDMAGGGRVLAGRYRLLGPLGRGGMGIVWRARDEVLGREVAVKEVRAPAGLDQAEVTRMYRRLEREAWAAARVSHRGVVTVYDVATEDGRPWIVMELVRGLSLADVLEAEGPLTPQRAAHFGEQVLAALRSAHEAGVLHRDVKPANVLVANDGRVVLSDFGIASLEGSSAITMTGEVIGSPEFTAPERALGRDPGPGSDLWSLGVMLYQAVEGCPPSGGTPRCPRCARWWTRNCRRRATPGHWSPYWRGCSARTRPSGCPRRRRPGCCGSSARAGTYGPWAGRCPVRTRRPPSPATRRAGTRTGRRAARSTAGPRNRCPRPRSLAPPAAGPRGQGRAGVLLTVGIVVLLLVLALLGWLLFSGRGGGGGTSTDGAGSSRSAAESPSRSPSDTASGAPSESASVSASASASASGSGSAQQVALYVRSVRDGYRGGCPPPAAQAPAFAATVEVTRLPVVLEYRWAARSGVASGPGWQSVTFEEGGPRSRQLEHTEPARRAGGTFEDAVRLEVRAPERAVSDWLEFSVTCEEETPTGGASSPGASGSPEPSASGGGAPSPEPETSP